MPYATVCRGLFAVAMAGAAASGSARAIGDAARRGSVPNTNAHTPSRDSLSLLPLLNLTAAQPLPRGWVVRAVRGEQAPRLTLVDSSGGRALRIAGTDRAAWFVYELERPIAPGVGTLAWNWRVLEHPAGADLRDRAADDAALRVFVVFARKNPFDRVPHTLFYTSGTVEGDSYERPSFQSSDLHMIRMGRRAMDGQWEYTVVDPFADYQRIWGGKPQAIVAVGLMQDSEETMSRTTADIRGLVWRTGARP